MAITECRVTASRPGQREGTGKQPSCLRGRGQGSHSAGRRELCGGRVTARGLNFLNDRVFETLHTQVTDTEAIKRGPRRHREEQNVQRPWEPCMLFHTPVPSPEGTAWNFAFVIYNSLRKKSRLPRMHPYIIPCSASFALKL